jgi:hypothetical protein
VRGQKRLESLDSVCCCLIGAGEEGDPQGGSATPPNAAARAPPLLPSPQGPPTGPFPELSALPPHPPRVRTIFRGHPGGRCLFLPFPHHVLEGLAVQSLPVGRTSKGDSSTDDNSNCHLHSLSLGSGTLLCTFHRTQKRILILTAILGHACFRCLRFTEKDLKAQSIYVPKTHS